MEIEDYRKQFMEQLRFDAEHEGTAPETQFIEKSLEILEETDSRQEEPSNCV